jgi:hypothetical protein
LPFKNCPRRELPKAFEATLRIPNFDPSQAAHQRVKSFTHVLAHPALMSNNLALWVLAIPHYDVHVTVGLKNGQSAINLVQRST